MKCLVIYFDGSDTHARLLEPNGNALDSTASHVWGLPDSYTVIATITGLDGASDFDVGRHTVYIEEVEIPFVTLVSNPITREEVNRYLDEPGVAETAEVDRSEGLQEALTGDSPAGEDVGVSDEKA